MSDHVRVQYGEVNAAMTQAQNRVSGDTTHCVNQLRQARGYLEQMGGMGNSAVIEGLALFEGGADLLASAAGHFLTAIAGSAQHLQTEEGIIANNFDLYR